jgi:hypothetical protein
VAEFFEMDPITGIKTETSFNEMTQEMTVIRTADVEPVLNFANEVRKEAGLNREGIEAGWWLYAKIPPIVIAQMHAKGIDISNEDHFKAMVREINEHYPHLKCTTGKEGKSAAPVYFMPKAND